MINRKLIDCCYNTLCRNFNVESDGNCILDDDMFSDCIYNDDMYYCPCKTSTISMEYSRTLQN